jgi:signal transduction histidine kinase
LEAAAPLLAEAGFSLEKKIAEDLPLVMGDAGALGQCLENLLSNAVKYGRAGRWVAVRARSTPGAEPAMVEISVEDKGPGIPPEDLSRVFEPFFRTKAARDAQIRGVGLGLHLVQRMMQAMGGRVDVASRLGWGAAFTLHVAAAPVGAAAEKTV